jgi:hypothetical protein
MQFVRGEKYRFRGVLTHPDQELTYLGSEAVIEHFMTGDGEAVQFRIGSDELKRLVPVDS